MGTHLAWPAYLSHLDADTQRFLAVLARTPAGARVPTCPEWDASDLLHHLGAVQTFWGRVLSEPALTKETADGLGETPRPDGHEALVGFAAGASESLLAALRATDPSATRWTWSSDHTAGFIFRRQAHEALIHRLDAELAADERTPLDAGLAADGVDEALRVMFGGCPQWGAITPQDGRTVRIAATDTDTTWLVTLARFTGTDPDGGASHDEPDIHVADTDDGSESLATVEGTAEDLDCWLWHRPPRGEIRRRGDDEVLSELGQLLDQPIT